MPLYNREMRKWHLYGRLISPAGRGHWQSVCRHSLEFHVSQDAISRCACKYDVRRLKLILVLHVHVKNSMANRTDL